MAFPIEQGVPQQEQQTNPPQYIPAPQQIQQQPMPINMAGMMQPQPDPVGFDKVLALQESEKMPITLVDQPPTLTEDEINEKLMDYEQTSERYYRDVIEPVIEKRTSDYYADIADYKIKFPKLSKISDFVTTDICDTIEWAMPSLMEMFFGSEDIVTVQGVGGEDEDRAKKFQELLIYQLQRKNPGFNIMYTWFKDGFITGYGVLKCSWEKQTKVNTLTDVFGPDSFQILANMPTVQIVDAQPFDMFGRMKVTYTQTRNIKNEPRLENVSLDTFRFMPSTKFLSDAPYVAQLKEVTVDHLRKMEKEGWYTNVEEAIKRGDGELQFSNNVMKDIYMDGFRINNTPKDEANRILVLNEAFVDIDINNDGMLEKMIITKVGSTILRIEENTYGRHPYFDFQPIRDPHRPFPKRSYADIVGPIQDLKTAMLRLIIQSMSISNDPKMVIDENAINVKDIVEGRMFIRKKASVPMADAVYPVPMTPLHPQTFTLLEYVEGMKESSTGITRYNQGQDASSLNKTATGISAIMGAANQRLKLIGRNIAEESFGPMLRFVLALNQKFIDQPTVIRLVNEPVQLTPDDLQGDFDLIINAGIGMTTKESTLMNLQIIMTTMQQVLQMGLPVCTPDNIYNLLKRWFEEMGFKNTDEFLTPPAIIQQQQMMAQLASLPPQVQMMVQTGQISLQQALSYVGAIQNGTMGNSPNQGTPQGGVGAGQQSQGVASTMPRVGESPRRGDNRQPQGLPRETPYIR